MAGSSASTALSAGPTSLIDVQEGLESLPASSKASMRASDSAGSASERAWHGVHTWTGSSSVEGEPLVATTGALVTGDDNAMGEATGDEAATGEATGDEAGVEAKGAATGDETGDEAGVEATGAATGDAAATGEATGSAAPSCAMKVPRRRRRMTPREAASVVIITLFSFKEEGVRCELTQ